MTFCVFLGCLGVCNESDIITQNMVVISSNTTDLFFECKSGYVLTSGVDHVHCANDNWIDAPPDCTREFSLYYFLLFHF